MLPLAAVVYLNNMDGSTFRVPTHQPVQAITPAEVQQIENLLTQTGKDRAKFLEWVLKAHGAKSIQELPKNRYHMVVGALQKKLPQERKEAS